VGAGGLVGAVWEYPYYNQDAGAGYLFLWTSQFMPGFLWMENKELEWYKIFSQCLKGIPSNIVNEVDLTSLIDC